MARITGLDRVSRRLAGLFDAQDEREIGRALFAAGQTIQVEAQVSITTGSQSGKGHVPSAPGSPPNQDTGMLANNIETTQPETLKVEVISNAPHSIPLEFGTSKMQARPFMRPAALKKQGEAARLVSAAVARNARKRT